MTELAVTREFVFICILKALIKYQEEHGEKAINITKIRELHSRYDL